jgi:hypothetical protein
MSVRTMRHKPWAFVIASLAGATLLTLISISVHAQAPQQSAQNSANASEKPYDWKASFAKVPTGKIPRTPDGKPDLQGLWSYLIPTPLELPGGLHKEEISSTEGEDAELDAQLAQIHSRAGSIPTPVTEKGGDNYRTLWRDGFWSKIPVINLHDSQVVDPPDGRVPPLTPAAMERSQVAAQLRSRPATGPEDRPITTRCVRGLWSGPPIVGQGRGSYLNNLQIIQDSTVVVVRQEVMHESQIIPLDGRPRPSQRIHLDKGSARGRWNGDTLVVESTNFKDWGTGIFSLHGTTEKMHLTERWKRIDEGHLLYGFTIDDPGTWTRPWSAEFIMWRLTGQEQLVEYACHEGNVGMAYALSGARTKEREQLRKSSDPR